jgi:hypothetical protein
MKKVFYIIGAIAIVVFALIVLTGNTYTEEGPEAIVTVEEGNYPMQIKVFVANEKGYPESGIRIHIVNHSGGNEGITDVSGITKIDVAELEVLQIKMNGRVIFDRSGTFSREPSAQNGLKVRIVKKL